MIQIFPYEMAAHLKVTDEDASDFLQSQFSNDLRPFDSGKVTYGLWLDAKGKVVADSWVYCEGPESFHIYSEHCSPSVIAAKLGRHIIADDVEINILPSAPALAVIGEEGMALAQDFGVRYILPGRRSIEPSVECVFETVEDRDAFLQHIEASEVSEYQVQSMRLKAGIPIVPDEIGPGELPGEGHLDEDAVAYDKGCFLGQEVVARMRNVGKATRGLYLVRGIGEPPGCPLDLKNEDDKVIGELRSAYPEAEGWRGVAILIKRHALALLQMKSEVGVVELESAFERVNRGPDNA